MILTIHCTIHCTHYALYSQLFDWLVARVNEGIRPGANIEGGGAVPKVKAFVGILDIFGFEV
jgi:myosin heavy subunit